MTARTENLAGEAGEIVAEAIDLMGRRPRTFHPAADIFPLLEGEEFDALVADIREHGLREPITVDAEGRILDGRNRYRACWEAGVDAAYTTYFRDDEIAFVVSMNLRRRHLDESQRAMVAASIANLSNGQRASEISEAVTQADAARMLNVSVDSVGFARKVKRDGGPDLVRAVEEGEVAVSTAAKRLRQSLTSSASVEWYTPAPLVDAAREVLGGIDLDPASCALANETVKAARYFSVDDDGLAHDWPGRVFLNPPYSGHAGKFARHALDQHARGITTAAVLILSIVPAGAAWFRPLLDWPICFVGRVPFASPTGVEAEPINGSAVVYLGQEAGCLEFARVFGSRFGPILRRWPPPVA